MKYFACIALFSVLYGCSSGLKEVSFATWDAQDGVHYIVNRSLVNDRVTAGQPHSAGQFHCTFKYTSVEMAELRQKTWRSYLV